MSWRGVSGGRRSTERRLSPYHGQPRAKTQQEVEQAIAHDVVVVAGVGNRPESQSVQYPAAIPGVLAVAGVDQNGNHSSVSVTGPEVVIAAPSDNISSTGLNGTWQVSTGTSDATAIVAGAVALVRSKFPQLKAADVVRRLTSTAIDKGSPGRDNEYGYGILNIVGALTAEATASSSPTKTTPPSQPANEEDQGQFRWWLIALPVTVAVAALGFYVWRRRLTTR
jgi:subtilisin family serine protease